jgi:MarR family transcriptional regulator, lower aerobic nicotinate degradation pathway regulator
MVEGGRMKKVVPVSSLEAHVGYWLRMVSNHVSHAFKLKVEARGVTVAEWVVMRQLLDSIEVNPSEVAERLGMTRGAISKLVERLVRKNLVSRKAGVGDRRFQTVKLTAEGRGLVPTLAALADQNDAEFFGHFSEEQTSALIDTLKEVVQRGQLKGVPVD